MVRVVGQSKEFEDWYRTLTNYMGTDPVAAWDLLSNANSREECLVDPKLPRRWGTRPDKLATVLGREPLKPGGEHCNAPGLAMWDLFPPCGHALPPGKMLGSRSGILMLINC